MAFSSAAVWEVRTTGDDTNFGGGFDTGVAGFSTDLTTTANTGNTATPEVSSASYNFVAGDVGAWLFIKSGTNWIPGWYKITSVASNKATVNAAIGAAVLFDASAILKSLSTASGVATTGTPTSGTWGIDYSQQDTAQFSSSTFAIGNPTTTNLTDGTNTIGKNWVGNIISITSGTGFTVQRIAVVSTSGTTATVDKTLGTAGSTNGVGKLGGALASMGLAGSVVIAQHTVMIKAGTYSITSASTNVAGGTFAPAGALIHLEGYSVTRLDRVSPPVLQASSITTFTLIASPSNGDWYLANLIVDGAAATSSRGLGLNRCIAWLITAKNCTNGGLVNLTGQFVMLVACSATGCSTQAAIQANACFGCESYNNTISGFATTGSGAYYIHCLSYGNTGSTTDGFQGTGTNMGVWINCIAYGNGRDGFRATANDCTLINCIAEGQTAGGAFGFNVASNFKLIDCAGFNNTTNNVVSAVQSVVFGFAILTASPFINAAGGNFALNNKAAGGQAVRYAGYPGTFPAGTSVGYLDIGAIQARWPMIPVGIDGVF